MTLTPGTHLGPFEVVYDVSPDGQRLLVVKRTQQTSQSRVNLIVNWQESVKSGN